MPRSKAPRLLPPAAGLLLAVQLLFRSVPATEAFDLGNIASTVKGAFVGGGGGSVGGSGSGSPLMAPGPIVSKTATAFLYAAAPSSLPGPLDVNNTGLLQLPLDGNCSVTVHRSGLYSVVLAFQGSEGLGGAGAAAADGSGAGSESDHVPYLEHFVFTAEAPLAVLDPFMAVVEGPGTQGTLADAVEELLGGDALLHITCTGQGRGGGTGLALLCGPWAALQFPTADVDVITFGGSWDGFNTQFTWSFVQLVNLHYQWPFDSSHPALAPLAHPGSASSSGGGGRGASTGPQAAPNGGGQRPAAALPPPQAGTWASAAQALSSLITVDSVQAAISVPSLPPPVPPDYSADEGEALGSLAPLPSQYEPPPSDCPLILCKTRDAVTAACLIFGQGGMQSQLPGLPKVRLHAASGADAVVAWNESSQAGLILWEGTESKIDWLQDAILFFSDDFRPGNLSAIIPGVKVHRGFLNQFSSFTTNPGSDQDNITSVLLGLSGGKEPQRIIVTGHSLGGALSELTGVWVSTVWPNASVLVFNSGAPRVGDSDWERMFTAVVGRAYRYVNHLDQVPELPPFNSFKQVPHGLWLRNGLVLLQDRPPYTRDQTTWNDHDCTKLYTPDILNATAVTVPGFIYNATAA